MGVPAWETAPPKRTALVGETMVKVCPKRGAGTSPETFTFSAESFFIQIINVQNHNNANIRIPDITHMLCVKSWGSHF